MNTSNCLGAEKYKQIVMVRNLIITNRRNVAFKPHYCNNKQLFTEVELNSGGYLPSRVLGYTTQDEYLADQRMTLFEMGSHFVALRLLGGE